MRPIVIVNFDQLMNQVKGTTKSVLSCIDNNQVFYQDENTSGTYLYLDPPKISTLQILYQDLQSRLWRMGTYGTAMSKETSIRYNHIHAEAVRALTNIQIFVEAAGMQVGLPTTHGNGDLGRSMCTTSQPPKTVEQIKNTNPDELMDIVRKLQTTKS